MVRVVFVLDYKGDELQIGGTSNYLKLLAPRVAKAGFDVRIAMPRSPRTNDLRVALEQSALPIDDLDTSPQSSGGLRRLLIAYKYLSAQNPDIVHFMLPWWNACEYSILGAWLARVPMRVATYHAVPEAIDPQVYRGVSGVARRQRHRFTFKCVDKAVAVSETNKRRLVANGFYSSEQVVVIRNGVEFKTFAFVDGGIDYRRKWGVDELHVLITVVGYLEEIKGHRYLLQALQEILRHHPNIVVAFVGDGVLRASLEAQVRENHLSGYVIFAGWQSDMPRILAASDLLVLPSLSEGLPFVILEAMAAGFPVVASRVGGIPEVITDGVTGVLVDPGSAQALQHAILSLLNNPERAKAMGKAAQAHARAEFDIGYMVDDIFEVYRNVHDHQTFIPSVS